MIASGIADPDRLGAFGWSYGGYMTFWILTQTDRFKAVSPGAAISNIYSMYSQNDIQRYLRWFYSDKAPWEATDLYWDRSPMKYVKNVKTPTMIMHGQVDTRVPIAQAQEFYMALKEMKVPVEFVVYPRENHGFTEPRPPDGSRAPLRVVLFKIPDSASCHQSRQRPAGPPAAEQD